MALCVAYTKTLPNVHRQILLYCTRRWRIDDELCVLYVIIAVCVRVCWCWLVSMRFYAFRFGVYVTSERLSQIKLLFFLPTIQMLRFNIGSDNSIRFFHRPPIFLQIRTFTFSPSSTIYFQFHSHFFWRSWWFGLFSVLFLISFRFVFCFCIFALRSLPCNSRFSTRRKRFFWYKYQRETNEPE